MCAVEHLQSIELHRDLRDFVGGQVILHDGGERDLIAAAEEAGHHQPHHNVLADDGVCYRAADLGVLGDAARGGAPRGDGVGIVEVHACLTVTGGANVGHPVRGVGEGLADLRLHQSLGLQLRHRLGRAHVGQLHLAFARLAVEVVGQRSVRAHLRIHATVEGIHDAANSLRFDGVDRLIDHAQAELRCDRLAAGVAGLDGVTGGFARLILRLRRHQLHVELVLRRRNVQALGPLIQLVAANEDRGDIEVRCVLRLDGDIDRDAAAVTLDHLSGIKPVAFGSH